MTWITAPDCTVMCNLIITYNNEGTYGDGNRNVSRNGDRIRYGNRNENGE